MGAGASPSHLPVTSGDPTCTVLPEGEPGTLIGDYQLVRQLGEGGMGVVYHAQQIRPLRRDVALKIIKPGMDSKQVIARFESERQALAMMEHPNIARVFDAGTTERGLPYFVMELVDGVPITSYCDAKHLGVRQRIELFIAVCKAIQHAHQKGIIHRDIKPCNILVTQLEGQPVSKVIDFGLAKALGGHISDATVMTNLGAVVGTLLYMSPEQAELTRNDVDTRADVYALGVLLYELFSGTTPLQRKPDESLLETLHRIRNEESKPPSIRIRRDAERSSIADSRGCDITRLPQLLSRELDCIVMKALEKDRNRRYETVNGLVRDLQRYLSGQTVEAAPPSTAYRIRKFVRRHRLGLATAAGFAVLLLASVVVSTRMAIRASRAEAEARAVNEFLQHDLLAQASTYNQTGTKPDLNLTVRTALDRAAARVEGKFTNQPLVEAGIRHTIAASYVDLGLYPEAERQMERALELRRRSLGANDRDTLHTAASLASVYERRGKLKEAEPLYLQVLESERRALGAEHPATLKTMNGLAVTYGKLGKYDKSEEIYTRLVPLAKKVFGPTDFQTLRSLGNLAVVYYLQRKYDQAESMYVETLDLKRRALGEEHPETLDTMLNLAELYRIEARYDKAQPLAYAALDGHRRALGDSHMHTIGAVIALATLERARGNYANAEALYSQSLETARRGVGPEHPVAISSLDGLAQTYWKQKRYAEAENLFNTALGLSRRILGDDHPDTLNTWLSLGGVRTDRGDYREAETTLRDALSRFEKAQPDTWERYRCQSLVGVSLAGQKRFSEAEPLLRAALAGLHQRQASIPGESRSVLAEAEQALAALDHREAR